MTDVIHSEHDDDLKEAELSPEQWDAEIDRQAESLMGMAAKEFLIALSTGELDRDDWRVEYLSGLIG